MMEYKWLALLQDDDDSDDETSEQKKLFFMASALGHINRMEEFLNEGIHIETKDYVFGETVFIRACRYNHVEVLEMLHCRGADINATSNTGETALHVAVKSSSIDCVEYLLSIPTLDLNYPDKLGQTALMVAAYKGHTKCVELLIAAECDVTAQDCRGKTVLHHALEPYDPLGKHNAYEIVQLLVHTRCDINQGNNVGYSPLHIAVKNHNWNAIRVLVFENCDLDIEGECDPQLAVFKQTNLPVLSTTPVLLALNFLNRRVVEFLISSGCLYQKYVSYLPYCEKDVYLHQYLSEVFRMPQTLKQACRSMIRKRLGRPIVSKVQRLQIPDILQSFILLKELQENEENVLSKQ